MFLGEVGGGGESGSLDAVAFHSGWLLSSQKYAKLFQPRLNSTFCPLMNFSNFWNFLASIKLIEKLLFLSFIPSSTCVRWQFLMTAVDALNSLKCFNSDKQCTNNVRVLIYSIQCLTSYRTMPVR